MTRSSRLYTAALMLMNLLCGWVLSRLQPGIRWCYKDLLEAHALPAATELAIRYHSWPFWIVAAGILALATAFITPKEKTWIAHISFLLMGCSLFLMLLTLVAYVTPITTTFGPLGPLK